MTFGDWEIFKNVVLTLREIDRNLLDGGADTDVRINVTSPDRERCKYFIHDEIKRFLRPCLNSFNIVLLYFELVGSKGDLDVKKLRPNVLEKQVRRASAFELHVEDVV